MGPSCEIDLMIHDWTLYHGDISHSCHKIFLHSFIPLFCLLIFFFQTGFYMKSSCLHGASCSSVVRAYAHGAMGRQIDPSWLTHWAISHSGQCVTTGETKANVCIILSVE